MPEPERTEGNQRRYVRAHLERLNFIRHARDLGFSVEAIRDLLSCRQRQMPLATMPTASLPTISPTCAPRSPG